MNDCSKTDRRYQRTHDAIINSAIELAEKSGWEKVSVTKLAEKANINRNSFYLHFNSINDVFDEIENEVAGAYHAYLSIASSLDDMLNNKEYTDAFFVFLENEKEKVYTISRIGRVEDLLSKLQKEWMRIVDTSLATISEDKKETIIPFLSGSIYIFFSNWINDPYGFDYRKSSLFDKKIIDEILKIAVER